MRSVVALALLLCLSAHARTPPRTRDEVEHLLAYIGNSGCAFGRNGLWYDSARARAHLSAKYAFRAGTDPGDPAEDFIENVATRSSLSGLPYLVRCDAAPAVPSARWLREELARYRGIP